MEWWIDWCCLLFVVCLWRRSLNYYSTIGTWYWLVGTVGMMDDVVLVRIVFDNKKLIKEEKKSKAKRKELEILHEKIAFEWEWATASKSNVAHRVVNGKKPLLPLNFRAVSKYFFFSYMHDSAHVVAVLWIKNQRIAVKRKQARKNETSSTTTTTYLPTYAVGTTWNSKLETLSVL